MANQEHGKPQPPATQEEEKHKRMDELLDEMLDDSFPASDPPSSIPEPTPQPPSHKDKEAA